MSGGTKKKEKKTAEGDPPITVVTTTTTDENVFSSSFDDYEPSVTLSVFVYWILPILVIVCMSRFLVDPTALNGLGIGPISDDAVPVVPKAAPVQPPSSVPSYVSPTPERPKRKPTPVPTQVAEKPTSYIEAVKGITRRRLNWEKTDSSAPTGYDRSDLESAYYSMSYGTTTTTPSSSSYPAPPTPPTPERPPRGASTDPVRNQMRAMIDGLRNNYQEDPDNLFKAIELADTLRLYDIQYHDGGTAQQEGQKMYKAAISLALAERERKLELGEDTKSENVPEEIMLTHTSKSIDGILCALYTNLGKVYFMSNMFERAVESYTKALDVEPMYLDAMSARGSSRLILGHYEGGALDFTTVRENDTELRFLDVYTGLSRILEARESVVPGGWAPITEGLNRLIPELKAQHKFLQNSPQRTLIAKTLNRMYMVMFLYHDVKTKDTDLAWDNLSKAYEFKLSTLEPWNSGFETQKVSTTKQIFQKGFWPKGVGSQTETPIFIIGFVRSGSTLLERVLDAHPKIVGTGENSVFNGRLDDIRNKIVESSMLGNAEALANVITSLADSVVDEMRERWEMGFSGDRTDDQPDPERFADKMLTNYYNVGFIHMLFPKALILHVVREPMDTIFSAYKHEFPQGTLDYTSDFPSLADLYHAYRDLMDHWDRELPGRVTHVRYEDMVHDMPGVARKIIEATDLEWDDSVLDFHKKKHAVNTLSTTQVRKGVYKNSLQAWKRYESHLGPLLKLIGERTTYDIKTALSGYVRPPPTPPGDEKVEEEEETEEDEEADTSTEAADTSLDDDQGESEEEEKGVEDVDPAETATIPDEAVEKSDEEEETEEDVADADSAETTTTPDEAVEKSDEEEGTEEEDVAGDRLTETTTIPEEAVENIDEEEETEEDVADADLAETATTPEEAVEKSDEEEETEEEDVADEHSTETTTTPEEAVENIDEEEETEEEDVADVDSAETTTTPEEAVENSDDEEEEDVADVDSTEAAITSEEAQGTVEEEEEEVPAVDADSAEAAATTEGAYEEDVGDADFGSTEDDSTAEEEEEEEEEADIGSTEAAKTTQEALENDEEEEEEEPAADTGMADDTSTTEGEEADPAADTSSAEAATTAEEVHEKGEEEAAAAANDGLTEADEEVNKEAEEDAADAGTANIAEEELIQVKDEL